MIDCVSDKEFAAVCCLNSDEIYKTTAIKFITFDNISAAIDFKTW